jgi:hypothetical protein
MIGFLKLLIIEAFLQSNCFRILMHLNVHNRLLAMKYTDEENEDQLF